MHRNVISRIIEAVGTDTAIFSDIGTGKTFMGEDIYFFALVGKAEVPVYCHTGAVVPHMKRFSFDEHYYKAFFGGNQAQKKSNLIVPKR